jgi:hypothetical protein
MWAQLVLFTSGKSTSTTTRRAQGVNSSRRVLICLSGSWGEPDCEKTRHDNAHTPHEGIKHRFVFLRAWSCDFDNRILTMSTPHDQPLVYTALEAPPSTVTGFAPGTTSGTHPDVFGALYIMSPCCMSSMVGGGPGSADQIRERAIASEKKVAAAKSPADLAAQSPGFASAQYATAAAWAPNPGNPPLYFDLPTKDGIPQPEIVAKYTANSPLAFVDQYIGNLKQYRAISMDVGDQDGLRIDAGKLHTILDNYGIANGFEIYPGTHTSAVADRFQNHVLPFFSKNLCFIPDCR